VHGLDRAAFRRPDIVVADTAANAAFYAEALGVEPSRLRVCFVGAEDRLFRPAPATRSAFHAIFVGKLIPLHGVETIVEAARLLPEVPFRIVGSGQLSDLLRNVPANVTRVPWIEYERLPRAIGHAGCALGVFGTSDKAARVIPNKAFQALACGTPLVTADTPAARELLTHGIDALLVPPGDAEALAAAIRHLAEDPGRASRIGSAGRLTYEREASEDVLGARWRALLEEVAR
jgi:glycosyltransferase involved in cell wall biosynthesis